MTIVEPVPGAVPMCFVFVCQRGDLEPQAMLLAASLSRFLPPGRELVAACPEPASRWGTPALTTLKYLERAGIRTVPISNRVSPDYPIGNKIDCLNVATTRSRLVFLDSDMLLLRPAAFDRLAGSRLGAVPASNAHIGSGDWERCYAACGVRMPDERMPTLLSGEASPPYFNAGLISVAATLGPALAERWSWCARRLLRLDDLPDVVRRRYLDQVSLPIAAAALGVEIAALDHKWNFPSWGMRIGDDPAPAFFHYQRMARVLREDATRSVFRSLLASDDRLAAAMGASLADG